MPTIHQVFAKSQDIQACREIARELGFEALKIFRPGVEGVLGLYALFNPAVPGDEEELRCLALTYKLSQLMGCQIVVVSDRDQRVTEEQTVDFENINTERFTQIFSALATDIELDSNTEAEYARKMLTYGILYTNFQSRFLINPDQQAISNQRSLPDSQKKSTSILAKRPQPASNDNLLRQEIQAFVNTAPEEQLQSLQEFIGQLQKRRNLEVK